MARCKQRGEQRNSISNDGTYEPLAAQLVSLPNMVQSGFFPNFPASELAELGDRMAVHGKGFPQQVSKAASCGQLSNRCVSLDSAYGHVTPQDSIQMAIAYADSRSQKTIRDIRGCFRFRV